MGKVTVITAFGVCSTGPWFSVEGKNEQRGVSGVSYLKKLYVTVDNITVTMMKRRTILVSMNYESHRNAHCFMTIRLNSEFNLMVNAKLKV